MKVMSMTAIINVMWHLITMAIQCENIYDIITQYLMTENIETEENIINININESHLMKESQYNTIIMKKQCRN